MRTTSILSLSRGKVCSADYYRQDRAENVRENLSGLYRFALDGLKTGISHRKFYMYGGVLFVVKGQSYYARGSNKKILSGFDPSRTCAEMAALDTMEEFLQYHYPDSFVANKVRVDCIMNFGDVQPDDKSGLDLGNVTCSCGHCRREFLIHRLIDNEETVTASTTLPSARNGGFTPFYFSTPKKLAEDFGTLPKQGAWRS